MMTKYILPEDSLSKSTCFVCEKPLSCFPIYNTEAGPSCGRCGPPQNGGFRCEFFEEIAKNVKFPCCNKQNGCLEILLPKDAENHELHCKFQEFACPFERLCKWKGFAHDFLEHTEEEHPTSLLADCCFEVDFINPHNKIKLMPYLDGLYLINYQCSGNQRILSCTVTHFGFEPIDDNLNYKIIFQDSGKQFNHTVYSDLNATVRIDKSALDVILRNPAAVLANIEVLQKKSVEGTLTKNANAGLLRHFECIVCMDYMIGPIYQCATGHSMCEPCKERLTECPTCKSVIQTTRNYTLEALVLDFEFPCKYEKCSYIGKGTVIREHQNACNFIEKDCPLKVLYGCEKKLMYVELSNHIYEEHNENWYECDVISYPFPFDEGFEHEEVFFLKYRSKLFQLNFSYANDLFNFAVELMDSSEESSKYRFVVDILDTTQNENRLCCSKNLKAEGHDNMEIDLDLIEHLIGEEFNFRVFVKDN